MACQNFGNTNFMIKFLTVFPPTGGADRPLGDPGPGGHFGDRQGLHDGRPAQRAHRAAREDCAGQLGIQRPQVGVFYLDWSRDEEHPSKTRRIQH